MPTAPPIPATNPFAAATELLVLTGVEAPLLFVLVKLVVWAVTVVVLVPEVDRTVEAVVVFEYLVEMVEFRPVAVAEKALQRLVPTV
jgi:hypothetical protein